MADYYPLISRAVAALDKNSGENRRAIYERARNALLAQLRGVTPPLSESDITRERLALEESIRKVEAESARQFVEATRQALPPRLRSAEFRQRDELPRTRLTEARAPESRLAENRPPEAHASEAHAPEARAPEARQWREPGPQAAPPHHASPPPLPVEPPRAAPSEVARRQWAPSLSPTTVPEARSSEEAFDQPPAAEPPPAKPAPRRSIFDFVRRERRDVVAEPDEEADGVAARAEKPAREPYDSPPPTPADFDRSVRPHDRLELDRPEPQMFDREGPQEPMFEPPGRHEPRSHEDFAEPGLESSFAADDEQLTPSREGLAPPPPIDEEMEFEPSDEEVQRRPSYRDLTRGLAIAGLVISIGGLLLWQWPNMVALYRSFRTPAVETTRETPPATAARPKITDRIEPGSQQAPATPSPAPGTQPAPTAAQKVVLYEEDPADPNGKRFVGSAIWRTETVTPAPGQPPELAVRADIEVPERKLAVTWSLRRNTDKGLPATHTVEIMFKLPADFPSGGISNVPGILMKQAEQTRGVPLAGLAVKVTPGFYLIGLSNLDADKERNLQLLKERGWFDIPVVYNNNRRAILAMEKGAPGERAFADAFKAWKQ
jgi:hypothetical protein